MNERIVYIDWIRIVAALMVVMIHTSGMLYLNNPEGSVSYLLGFWNQELVRSAVPLFFMISGALLLRPDYDANPRKMAMKSVKLLLLMFVWSFVYALVSVHPLTIKGIVFATIKGHFHFWFFEYLIGLYLLTPIFKAIVDYKDGILVRYYLVLFIFFGIIVASLQAIPYCHKWIMDATTKVRFEWLGFAGYFFLGHYLHQKRLDIPKWILVLDFVGAILLQGFVFTNMGLLYSSDKFWWLTIIETSALYILFANIQSERMAWGGGETLVFARNGCVYLTSDDSRTYSCGMVDCIYVWHRCAVGVWRSITCKLCDNEDTGCRKMAVVGVIGNWKISNVKCQIDTF